MDNLRRSADGRTYELDGRPIAAGDQLVLVEFDDSDDQVTRARYIVGAFQWTGRDPDAPLLSTAIGPRRLEPGDVMGWLDQCLAKGYRALGDCFLQPPRLD